MDEFRESVSWEKEKSAVVKGFRMGRKAPPRKNGHLSDKN